MSWKEGYVIDTPYTYGYYPEMSPLRIGYAMATAGYEGPPPGPCCELGFGQGVTLNLSAAGDLGRSWWGNDFNPSQARFAQCLARASGVIATITDESFAEFCSRDDLPLFSVIALHGIWSWISPENQRIVLDFVRRRLAVGGVLYVSYNTPAGWASLAPTRTVFVEHARATSEASLDSVQRMQRAMDFVARVLDTNPVFLKMNPSIRPRLDAMRKHSNSYLPHEYLNADWILTSFADMARILDAQKLTYAGNAALLERIESLHLDENQRRLLAEIRDLGLRETVREFMSDIPFRRDYWVRGPRPLGPRRHAAALQEQAYILSTLPDKVPANIKCARGQWDLNPEVYNPLISTLDAQEAPITRAELAERLAREHKIGVHQFNQALSILVAIGAIQHCQPDQARRLAQPHCRRLNEWVLQESAESFRVGHLVSPVTGLGIAVDFVTQLILAARQGGLTDPARIAAQVHDSMVAQNQDLRVDGKPVDDAQALTRLTALAGEFEGKYARLIARLALF